MKQILTILFLFSFAFVNATIINVPSQQPTIQLGIDAALVADTVLVAPGIYYENTIDINKYIVVGSYFLTTGDTTYIDSTVVDGSAQNEVFLIGKLLLLSGFTIRNGSRFGGIWVGGNTQSTPIIANNIIIGNQCTHISAEGGGGILIENEHATIRNNKIINNHSDADGGGIYVSWEGQATILNNIISDNTAAQYGGGIATDITGRGATITGNTISHNIADHHGGGISCQDTIGSVIKNNLISDNSTGNYGGGIYCNNNANPVIKENNIIGNSAIFGDAIQCSNNSNPDITNNIVADHSTIYTIELISSSPLLRNNTFYNNSCFCIIQCSNSDATIINNLLVSNSGTAIYSNASNLTIAYNDFYNQPSPIFDGNIPPGIGILSHTNANGDSCDVYSNIFLDPLLVDLANYDFHLTEDSPCIDAGDPVSPLDPDGSVSDMGTYYFDQTTAPSAPQNVTVEISGTEVHLSWDVVAGANSYKVYSSDEPYTGFAVDTTGTFDGESWSAPISDVKKFYYVKASTETY